MSDLRTHAAFVSILDKHAPKKTKNFTRDSKTQFNKNLRKQIMIGSRLKRLISQKILFTLSSLSGNETWWQI